MESSQPSQEPITRRVAVEGSSDAVVLVTALGPTNVTSVSASSSGGNASSTSEARITRASSQRPA